MLQRTASIQIDQTNTSILLTKVAIKILGEELANWSVIQDLVHPRPELASCYKSLCHNIS